MMWMATSRVEQCTTNTAIHNSSACHWDLKLRSKHKRRPCCARKPSNELIFCNLLLKTLATDVEQNNYHPSFCSLQIYANTLPKHFLDAFLPVIRGTVCLLHEGRGDKLSLTLPLPGVPALPMRSAYKRHGQPVAFFQPELSCKVN